MTFKDLGLIDPILKALNEQGYEHPSPIQEKAIGPALQGRDVLGCAQTGTGKTCAFATPILQQLHSRKPVGRPIRALILTPTRELALQIQENFEAYGRHLPLRSAVIFGGVGQAPQVDKLKRGLDILVATPGRLMDLQGQGFIDLRQLEIFVLDEADRMLDMGFIHDVKKILKLLPEKKQTLFFSATMPPEVTEIVNALLKNPVKVAVDPVSSPVEVIDQTLYFVDKANKSKLLAKLFADLKVKNALVFTRTKHGANKVAGDLEKAGISAAAIHGNKSQTARQQALADFKNGKIRALVATDIAARGIDIDELSHVFNYNLPEVAETYIHRIGRTGRAGREGTAVAFCDFAEKAYLKDIERLIGKKVSVVDNHPWPMEVFEVAVKDAKGRLVNADIAESREAARERKAERRAAEKQAASAKPAAPMASRGNSKLMTGRTAPVSSPAPRQNKSKPAGRGQAPAAAPAPSQPQKSKRGFRHEDLRGTMPTAPTQASGDFQRRSALDGDTIMDATARLLAPKARTQPPAAPQRPSVGRDKVNGGSAPREGGLGHDPSRRERQERPRSTGKAPSPNPSTKQQAKPAQSDKSAAPKMPFGQKKNNDRNRGRRGGPPEVALRPGSQKDSTEQPTLIKPYYINHDD